MPKYNSRAKGCISLHGFFYVLSLPFVRTLSEDT